MKTCEICGRIVSFTTRHHLIPQSRGGKKRVKRDFQPEEIKKKVDSCKDCHKMVHALFSERDLELRFRTLESLKSSQEMSKYIEWVKERPEGAVSSARRRRDW